jgi:hypothetical protein
MTDYGTIKLPRDEYERHNNRRQDLGLTWAEYIDGAAPQTDIPDADELASAIVAAMDTEALGMDAEGLVRDLEASLPRKVANEMESR